MLLLRSDACRSSHCLACGEVRQFRHDVDAVDDKDARAIQFGREGIAVGRKALCGEDVRETEGGL